MFTRNGVHLTVKGSAVLVCELIRVVDEATCRVGGTERENLNVTLLRSSIYVVCYEISGMCIFFAEIGRRNNVFLTRSLQF